MPRLGAHKYQGEAGSGCVQSIDPHPTPLNSPWVLPKLPTLPQTPAWGGWSLLSTLAVIRLEPGGGRADSHPGRVAQVLCEATGCAAGILGGH